MSAPAVSPEREGAELKKLQAEIESHTTKAQTDIVTAWPPDEVADQLTVIGLGALGTGGVAYVLLGYPGLTNHILPPLVSWIAGVIFLGWGLKRLDHHSQVRMDHFMMMFKVQDSERVPVAQGPFFVRAWHFIMRKKD